jgi:hypothetical protein
VLLSAPLTMIFKIVCEAFPETRWIAVMLSTNEDLHRHGHAPRHPAQG